MADACAWVPLSSYNWSRVLMSEKTNRHCALPWNGTVWCLFAALHGIAVWSALELQIQIFAAFKRRSTLYFWSLLASSSGVILLTIYFDVQLFGGFTGPGWAVLSAIGWVPMVTGFSLILYSRLHLITTDARLLRGVLCAILANGFLFHTPVVVSGFLQGDASAKVYRYSSMFETVFVVQEVVLSTLYTCLFWRFLREHNHTTFRLLIAAQAVILLCDIPLLVLLYLDYFIPRMMILTFTYSLKTRIEFLVLNRLRRGTRNSLTRPLVIRGDDWDPETPATLDSDGGKMDSTISEFADIIRPCPVIHGTSQGLSFPGDEIVPKPDSESEKDSLHVLERQYLGTFN